MIRALIFDLDGTLVQTERLKAISYARAARELCPENLTEEEVITAFKDVVGLPRREVAVALVERFSLAASAAARMISFGVSSPWQAFVQIRLKIYNQMLADPKIIRHNQWPHNVALLQLARASNCKVGLATMSHCQQASRVLKILALEDQFDFIATIDDVRNGKPDPEIYQLAADELGLPPGDCLVIEDSPTGVKAAQAAGMPVVAVSTPFTEARLHTAGLLSEEFIVDQPEHLITIVRKIVGEKRI